MTDDILFTAPPTIPAGTYPITITRVGAEVIETAEGPKNLVRWVGEVEVDDGPPLEVDALSSLNFGQRAKARRWAAALLGVDVQELRASDLVGRKGLAVLTEDDNGFTKLADIVAAPRAKA